jgi:hypothetical protein
VGEQLFTRGRRADARRELGELLLEVLPDFFHQVGFVFGGEVRSRETRAHVGTPIIGLMHSVPPRRG